MTNSVDGETLRMIVNCEQDSVVANAQPIAFDVGEFLHLWMSRVHRQLLNAPEDQETLRLWEGAQVFLNALVVGELVHGLDQPAPLQTRKELWVGERSVGRAYGPSERPGVISVFRKTHELLIADEGEDHGLRVSSLINNEAIWSNWGGHAVLLSGPSRVVGERSVRLKHRDQAPL